MHSLLFIHPRARARATSSLCARSRVGSRAAGGTYRSLNNRVPERVLARSFRASRDATIAMALARRRVIAIATRASERASAVLLRDARESRANAGENPNRGFGTLAQSSRSVASARGFRRVATPRTVGAMTFHRMHAAAAGTAAPKPTPVREMRDEFLNATSASYLEAMEDDFRRDPKSVPESWAMLLRQLGEWSEISSESARWSR